MNEPSRSESSGRSTTADPLRSRLRRLYFGSDPQARRFRLTMLGIDLLLMVYFVVGSFYHTSPWVQWIDAAIAVVLGLEWLLRLWLHDLRWSYFRQIATWTDALVIISLLIPLFDDSYLFLRVMRLMRLFRSYHVLRDLREISSLFRRNEELIEASGALAVFIFVMSAVVYVLQAHRNPGIDNYVDALYFTVTTLTTTGFGDIVMRDVQGRLLAVAIMIAGFGFFLRLVQAIFRPSARRFVCPDCGLSRHDRDAVHCKHCGRVINIPDEGFD